MHPTLRYRFGNEHSAESPAGRFELTVDPDGQARLDHFYVWLHRAWAGAVEPAVVDGVHAALATSSFPDPYPHDRPVPAGSAFRSLGIETTDGQRAGVSIPWHEANALAGYKETFALLDALVLAMYEGGNGGPEVSETRTVLHREGWDWHVWRNQALHRFLGVTITALDRVTVNGTPRPATLAFIDDQGKPFALIAEQGELTMHEGPPAPDLMPGPEDVVGLESVGVELPITVGAVTETWAGEIPNSFLAAIELHSEVPAPKAGWAARLRRRPQAAGVTLRLLTDGGEIELPSAEEFAARLRRLEAEHGLDPTHYERGSRRD